MFFAIVFFKQKTAYEMRISDWSSDVCSSDLRRLRVDQVVRHDGRHVDGRHALLDRTLHAQQADAIRDLQQLADRTHAAVAEVVDIVDLALAVLPVHQLLDHSEDVLAAQRRRSAEHTSELPSPMPSSHAL